MFVLWMSSHFCGQANLLTVLKLRSSSPNLLVGKSNALESFSVLGPADSIPLNNPFSRPDLIPKLATNPVTAKFLEDRSYLEVLNKLKSDPKLLRK